MIAKAIEDTGPSILATTYIFLVLSTIAVALRFWSRYIAHRAGFWWDDWLALASLPFFWALCGMSIYWVSIGLGKHIQDTPQPHYRLPLMLFCVNFIYNTALSLVKMSVLMFYARIFGTVKTYRFALYSVGFVIVGWWVAIDFLALLACTPIEKAWRSVPGHCLNTQHDFIGATSTNIIADVLLLILPIPMLWKLQIDRTRRVALLGIFTCGYCVVVLSILRFVSVINLGASLKDDISWNLGYLQKLVVSEVGVALISSCLPSILNLLKHGLRRHSKYFGRKMQASHSLSGPAGGHLGPVANPIEEQDKKGFVQLVELERGNGVTGTSEERLFDSQIVPDSYGKTTTLASKARGQFHNMDIPDGKIRVQEDFHVTT